MRIEIKHRNVEINGDLRQHIEKRFGKLAKQVPALAQLNITISEEKNPAIAEPEVVDARLYLKGATLYASESSPDPFGSINLCAEQLERQVKRYREKRRARRTIKPQPASASQFPLIT